MTNIKNGKPLIEVVEYDPDWVAEFDREQQRISSALGSRIVAIEHIGSTAVPGLRAKPIIDIMVGIEDLAEATDCIELLTRLGYRYLPEREADRPDCRFFNKSSPGSRSCLLHMYEPRHPDWGHLIRLREYFGRHPEAAREYETLKQELAQRFPDDPSSYIDGKREYLREVREAAAREAAAEAPSAQSRVRIPVVARVNRFVRRGLGRAGREWEKLVRPIRVGGWPRSFRSHEEIDRRLAQAPRILEKMLVDLVLPFWRSKVVDWRGGGYHLHHDLAGNDLGPAYRNIIAQTRTLWFFSRIARSNWAEPSDIEAANHGFEFLSRHLWDHQYGGFSWEVLSNGEAIRPHKHALAQCYALIALTEYWRASSDHRALALVHRLVELWEEKAHDPLIGRWVEMHRRDWSGADGLIGYWTSDPSLRTLDTHLHIAEALAAVHRVAPDSRLESRTKELLKFITEADSGLGPRATVFRSDWTPLPSTRVEYGFDVKRIVVTSEVSAAIGVPAAEHIDLYHRLFDEAMRCAWDRCNGGLFKSGRPGARADELVKEWWTQAEVLGSSLLMWRLTGQDRYATVFLRTLEWVDGWQADWHNGDWFERIDYRRRPSGRKAYAWKGPYHVPRTILECLEVLSLSSVTEPA